MRNIFIPLFTILLVFNSCIEELPEENNTKKESNIQEVLVQEVIHAGRYTYLKVTSDRGENWLAVPKTEAKPGDIFYHTEGMPMKDFKSKELNKTFPLVWFLNKVYKSPDEINKVTMPSNHSSGSDLKIEKTEIKVEPAEGGITIAELFSKKEDYNGKRVKIRAKVVKFSANIMNTNWVHLQDGTDYEGKYDLVVTSKLKFKVGSIVTITGKVAIDKDFGHGYFYEVIVEDANSEIVKM